MDDNDDQNIDERTRRRLRRERVREEREIIRSIKEDIDSMKECLGRMLEGVGRIVDWERRKILHRVLDETVVKMMTVAVVTGSSDEDDIRDDISSVPPPKKRIRRSGSSSASTSESPSHLDLSQSPPPLWLLWPEVVERVHRNDEYDPYSITYRAVRFGLDGSHADGGINHGS